MTFHDRNLRKNILLIGDAASQIIGSKLPSKLQVLKALFYNTRVLQLMIHESATITAKEVFVFWDKAGIPVQTLLEGIRKIKKLHARWNLLQERVGKKSNEQKELAFKEELKLLLDIACVKKSVNISAEKKLFLENQQKRERIGFIADVESRYDELTTEKDDFALEERAKRKFERKQSSLGQVVQFASSSGRSLTASEMSNFSTRMYYQPEGGIAGPSQPKKSRGTSNILNEKVVATLDKCQVSDRNAVRVIAAVAEACHCDVNAMILNRSSIYRYRRKIRQRFAEKIKKLFPTCEPKATVLHWDGKLFKEFNQNHKVERLVIVITDGDHEIFLCIPALENGTGLAQANAIIATIQDWGLFDLVKGIFCDTTISNLGPKNGAAMRIEQALEKDLLYLACRHHIFRIVVGGVFDALMPASTGPSVLLFKRFQTDWEHIDQEKIQFGTEDERVLTVLQHHIEDINDFVSDILNSQKQPRNDYRELLLLCLIFIGKCPHEQVNFYKPGAFSRARWMGRAIYC